MTQPNTDIRPASEETPKPIDWLEIIRAHTLAGLAGEKVTIALFGSHAQGEAGMTSDVDVAVIPRGDWDQTRLTLLREKLENSNIPCKVDFVDFSLVSPEFQRLALQRSIWWRQ